jgi:hypothetical protein
MNMSRSAVMCLALLWAGLPCYAQRLRPGELAPTAHGAESELWELAREAADVHRFSTLFTAQAVRVELATDQSITQAINWCKQMGVTKVYLETFRNGYQADATVLNRAAEAFRRAGLTVSGCVTPTKFGKPAKSHRVFHVCHTSPLTHRRAGEIFAYAAGLFDEVMIDDFWSSYCECEECDAARKARSVRVAGQTFATLGESWSDYRLVLMREVSRKYVIEASRRANPRVKLILKYPNWYDNYHERGYDVITQTADFDRIWVGNETREIDNPYHAGIPQYAGYFIMRWLGQIAGDKCGGGWYDPMETMPATYVEQARQTILGGAAESVLFSYTSLRHGEKSSGSVRHGPADAAALKKHIPELLMTARQVRQRTPVGIAAYKPPHSDAGNDFHIFDFAGMVGLPLMPCHEFPSDAPAAMFSMYSLKDPQFATKIAAFVRSGKPVLVTAALASKLRDQVELQAGNVRVLHFIDPPQGEAGRARSWMRWTRKDLNRLRKPLLTALGIKLDAPAGVALYPFDDGSWVLENFTDSDASVVIQGEALMIPARNWIQRWR